MRSGPPPAATRRRAPLAAAVALAAAFAACGGGAEELMDTAHLEELQHNRTHARELYRQVVERYPDTPQAKAAAERLRLLAEETEPPR